MTSIGKLKANVSEEIIHWCKNSVNPKPNKDTRVSQKIILIINETGQDKEKQYIILCIHFCRVYFTLSYICLSVTSLRKYLSFNIAHNV